MPTVAALYRYPLKGFTPEPRATIAAGPDGRIVGDRVLNFRFADAPAADDEWCRKSHGVVLVNTPGLARLAVRFDERTQRLRLALGDTVLADEGLDAAGRERLVAALTRYVDTLEENPLKGHPERLPLKLVGDGTTPRYQDNSAGYVTLHSRESLASAGAALGDTKLSELRFRSNIAIEGVEPWAELSWIGQRVRIGSVEFDVAEAKTRCLATHANPQTGERDLQVMQTLVKAFEHREPTFGVALLPHGAGGTIAVGDPVTLLERA
jgi:MOSC domain-containing protein